MLIRGKVKSMIIDDESKVPVKDYKVPLNSVCLKLLTICSSLIKMVIASKYQAIIK